MRTAEKQVATALLCAVFPILWWLDATLGQALSGQPHGWPYAADFHPVWHAARQFLHGTSPYPAPDAVFHHSARYTGFFVYTMPVAALFSPLGALPYGAAAAVMTVLSTLAILGALRLLGLRDWRCYGIAFATPAAMTAVSYGTLSPLLALAVAVAWRYRRSPWTAGLAVALAVVAKLFLWPLLLWLLLARRFRAAAIAVGIAAALALVAWARIGFADVASFPTLMRNLAQVEAPRTVGAAAFLGSGAALSAVTAVVLAAAVVVLRRLRNERTTFTALVLLAVWLSPIVWTHYYALVFVLLVLWSPRFGLAWAIPLALWPTLFDSPWRAAIGLAASAAAVVVAARGTPEGPARPVLSGIAAVPERATIRT